MLSYLERFIDVSDHYSECFAYLGLSLSMVNLSIWSKYVIIP